MRPIELDKDDTAIYGNSNSAIDDSCGVKRPRDLEGAHGAVVDAEAPFLRHDALLRVQLPEHGCLKPLRLHCKPVASSDGVLQWPIHMLLNGTGDRPAAEGRFRNVQIQRVRLLPAGRPFRHDIANDRQQGRTAGKISNTPQLQLVGREADVVLRGVVGGAGIQPNGARALSHKAQRRFR